MFYATLQEEPPRALDIGHARDLSGLFDPGHEVIDIGEQRLDEAERPAIRAENIENGVRTNRDDERRRAELVDQKAVQRTEPGTADRGGNFKAVNTALSRSDLDAASPSDVLSTAASGFLDAVGTSTGPLYATDLRRAAQALAGRDMLIAIAKGIRNHGKTQCGDKTILDVWLPAAEAASSAVAGNHSKPDVWNAVETAAETGGTAPLVKAMARLQS